MDDEAELREELEWAIYEGDRQRAEAAAGRLADLNKQWAAEEGAETANTAQIHDGDEDAVADADYEEDKPEEEEEHDENNSAKSAGLEGPPQKALPQPKPRDDRPSAKAAAPAPTPKRAPPALPSRGAVSKASSTSSVPAAKRGPPALPKRGVAGALSKPASAPASVAAMKAAGPPPVPRPGGTGAGIGRSTGGPPPLVPRPGPGAAFSSAGGRPSLAPRPAPALPTRPGGGAPPIAPRPNQTASASDDAPTPKVGGTPFPGLPMPALGPRVGAPPANEASNGSDTSSAPAHNPADSSDGESEKHDDTTAPAAGGAGGKLKGVGKKLRSGGGSFLAMGKSMSVLSSGKPKYSQISAREESFAAISWPHDTPLLSQIVAAGFYSTVKGMCFDRVTCFACGLVLQKWSPQDDPQEEHRKQKPGCSFVISGFIDPPAQAASAEPESAADRDGGAGQKKGGSFLKSVGSVKNLATKVKDKAKTTGGAKDKLPEHLKNQKGVTEADYDVCSTVSDCEEKIRSLEMNIDGLDKLSGFYASDPEGKANTDKELEEQRALLAKFQSKLSELGGGSAAAHVERDADDENVDIANWQEFFDDDGNPYYYNSLTEETVWEAPAGWS